MKALILIITLIIIISGVEAEWKAKDSERAGCLYRAGSAKNYFAWREGGGKSTLVHVSIWKLQRTGRRFQEEISRSADRGLSRGEQRRVSAAA